MRISLSLTQSLGVNSFIVDGNEIVAAWMFCEEKDRNDVKEKLGENKQYPIMNGSVCVERVNCSTCFFDKELKVDHIYKGSQFLLINTRASGKSATLDKQYFLIDKDIEDQIGELKKKFFDKNIKKLPLPVHLNWETWFWEGVQPFFKELVSYGNPPYKGYVLSLPSIEIIQTLVEESHVSFEFHNRFKRVPKLKSLLAVGDTENFDFKAWQDFMTAIGGQEKFTAFDIERQKGIVRAFELLGLENSGVIMEMAETWHTTSLRPVNIFLRTTADKVEKAKIKRAFVIIFEKYRDDQSYLYPAISNFEALYKETSQNIFNKNFESVEKFLSQISYESVVTGAEEMSRVCSKAKVSQHEYKMFETLYLKYLDNIMVAPRSYPTVFRGYEKDLVWESIDMSVPRAWVVGIETYCCMHPTSCGGACLEYAAQNPETSFIFRVAQKGTTIAQSICWISAPDAAGDRILCMDNIEVAGREIRGSIKNAYLDFANAMEQYAKLFKIKAITIGHGYTDVDLSDFCEQSPIQNNSQYFAARPKTLGYSDAGTQSLLRKYK